MVSSLGILHTVIYFINFAAGLTFIVTFAVEIGNTYDGNCPLYMKLNIVDSGVSEDKLPICNLLIIFYTLFQTFWPLLIGWLYAVASGICNTLCDNRCCCPTTSNEAAAAAVTAESVDQPAGSDNKAKTADDSNAAPEAAVEPLQRSGVCHRCCFCVFLIDFRRSRMRSFRSAEWHVFAFLASIQFAITAYFGVFLVSLFLGYSARCSITDVGHNQVRLYFKDQFGSLRNSDSDIMDIFPYKLLEREDLCFGNLYTIIIVASSSSAFVCNLVNLFLYIWRRLKGLSL